MDGVLVDAKEWHFDALNQALELFGFKISRFEHVRRYDGLPTRRKLKMLTEDQGFPESLHEFVHQMKQQYLLNLAADLCIPNDRHLEALSRLRHEGYLVGLASNSIRKTVDLLMRRTELDPYLHTKLSNEDVSAPKPDPEIYQLAIRQLGVEPHECLVVEDGVYGIEAATKAGAHVHAVKTVDDVHYEGIRNHIANLDNQSTGRRAA
ncbi:MAG: HAD family phosphatase [Pirellulales bacterium]|nr:HAD family phosphatase [Pirellulales bacterium]